MLSDKELAERAYAQGKELIDEGRDADEVFRILFLNWLGFLSVRIGVGSKRWDEFYQNLNDFLVSELPDIYEA